MLAVASPLMGLVCMTVGTFHQIQIIWEQGYCKELSLFRTLLGVIACCLSVLYGLELHNIWMVFSGGAGILMNSALALVIVYLRKKSP